MKRKNPLYISMIFTFITLFAATLHAGGLKDVPSIRANATSATLRVHPGSSVRATFDSEDFAEAKISIVSASGKVLMDQAMVLDPGANVLNLKVSDIPAGAYFIKVQSPSGTKVTTLVVQ